MDLRALLGDAYKENMTFAEVEAALAGVVMHTDADVKENFVSKRLFDKTASDLAAAKRGGAAAAAQAKTDLDAAMERIAALEERDKANTRISNIATHKASLLAQGYADDLATDAATALVDGDIAAFMVAQGKYNVAREQKLKEDLMKGTKPPAAGGSASGGGIDFAKAKADALAAGNDIEYMRLLRAEAEQAAKN